MNKFLYLFLVVSLSLSFTACDEDLWKFSDDSEGSYKVTEGEPIATTLENTGEFSEWIKVLNYTDTYSTLNAMYDGSSVANKFTVFAPTDSALQAFYAEKGVSSIEELSVDYATAIVKTLTYTGDSLKLTEVFSADYTLGYKNEADEYLYLSVNSEAEGFLMYTQSDTDLIGVSRSYIDCSNGFVYTITGVPAPLVETVYDRIVEEGASSIMVEALKATGYDAVLSTLADTTYTLGVRSITKHNYTFLNVTDAAFARTNIYSLANLKDSIAAHATDASVGQDSLLKQYIQYHLFEASYSANALSEMVGADSVRIWSTSAPNQIMMIHRHILSTYETEQEDGTVAVDTFYYTSFNENDTSYTKPTISLSYEDVTKELDQVTLIQNANVLAKNGYLHSLTDWLPVYEPQQSTVVWDLADYTEVRNALGSLYQPAVVVSSETKNDLSKLSCYTVEDGPDGSSNNSYSSLCYVTCKSNLKNCLNHDRVVFNVGYQGSVTMSTPTLVKGKYKVTISMAYLTELAFIRTSNGCKGGMMRLTVDGENQILTAPYTTITKSLAGVYETTLYDEIEFTETASHQFKFVVMDPAASTNSKFSLQFDAITFTPIE